MVLAPEHVGFRAGLQLSCACCGHGTLSPTAISLATCALGLKLGMFGQAREGRPGTPRPEMRPSRPRHANSPAPTHAEAASQMTTSEMQLEQQLTGMALSASASTDSLADSLPDQSIADMLRARMPAAVTDGRNSSSQTLPPQSAWRQLDTSAQARPPAHGQFQVGVQAGPSQSDTPAQQAARTVSIGQGSAAQPSQQASRPPPSSAAEVCPAQMAMICPCACNCALLQALCCTWTRLP